MSNKSRGNVLFADDDAAVRRLTALALHRAGFEVAPVGSGEDALALHETQRFDVLLADIAMPGNGDLELVEQVARGPFLPVVLITGYPSAATAIQALRQGVVDYVTKPVEFDDLFARLDSAIEKGRVLRAVSEVREQANQLASMAESLETALGVTPRAERALTASAPRSADPLSKLPSEELALLSPRERDVLRLLAVGNPVADAARTLNLSANTVRNHVKTIFLKLRVRSQVALLGKLAGHVLPNEGVD